MPISFGGMASGVDTEEIIKKLVQVESRPILQWEQEKTGSSQKRQALNTLKGHLTVLQDAIKDLYGFRAAYFDKSVISSDPGVAEATADKFASKGSNTIIVKELASTHKINTEPVKKSRDLEGGKFKITVNGEERQVRFKGGKIAAFNDVISEAASDIISSNLINTEGDLFTMMLESKVPGAKGEILISGDKSLLNSIGLIRGEKGATPKKVEVVFDRKFFTAYGGKESIAEQNGSLFVNKEGREIRIKGTLWREYVLPLEMSIKEDTTLEFDFAFTEPKERIEDEALPFRVEIGPEEKTVIKGIELNSYNIPRIRPLEETKKKDSFTTITGIGVISSNNGDRTEKIYSIDTKTKGKQEIPVGRDFKDKKISKIIFYCNEGEAGFSNTAILTPEKGTGFFEPKHVITKSGNARVNVDGIDVIRDKNSGLNDIIKGLTLNLKRSSMAPVTLTVEPNSKNAVEKVKKFVESYNAYIDYSGELTNVERVSQAGPSARKNAKTGLFVGDMTILRLENTIKMSISNAYPSKSDTPIKILSQMGINTGALNADWETIKSGKLVLDEEKFSEVLNANPDGVKDFFGSDTDGDSRIDNGMAFKLQHVLKPFIMPGKSIIQAKIDYENEAIKLADDRISRHQDHLSRFEDKLRRKFSAMERSISGTKAQGNWLDAQMGGGQGEKSK